MISAITREPSGTIKLTITIPSNVVKKTWDEITEEGIKNIQVPGFRAGKAPRKLAEERLDTNKIREETLRKLLPKYYVDAVKEHSLKPIINPKIQIEKIEGQADWQFTASTCEVPQVNLGNYKVDVQKITAKSKIIVPGKESFDATQDKPKAPSFDEIIKATIESAKVEIPQILIDQEVERLLSQLLDEVKKLGLSLDQYLSSTGKTAESIRKEYEEKAKFDIKIEFVLQKIAEAEKIVVEEKEIEEAITKAKDENEKKNLQANRYLLANILRQQKTLDFLKNL